MDEGPPLTLYPVLFIHLNSYSPELDGNSKPLPPLIKCQMRFFKPLVNKPITLKPRNQTDASKHALLKVFSN